MDEPEIAPLPPLPIGDPGGVPGASPDALRHILRRHQRRQLAVIAAGLATVLVAGSLAGWAVGRRGHDSAGVRVAAGGQPSATSPQAAAQPAIAPLPGGSSSSGGVSVSGSSGPSTQLAVRDAADGTRVRLYEQEFAAPTVTCATGQTCPQPPVASCQPVALISAEVSDDQVAGQSGGPVWQQADGKPLDVVSIDIVGSGQPQPILVVVARTAQPTAKVTVTTAYGTDTATPSAGWVALAVRLPADFSGGPTGAPAGKVVAADGGGNAIASSDLSSPPSMAPSCVVGPCVTETAPSSPTSTATVAPPVPAGGGGSPSIGSGPTPGVATAPATPCQPCPIGAPAAAPGAGATPSGAMFSCATAVGGGYITSGGTVVAGGGSTISGSSSSGSASSGTASSGPASTTP